jgi:hypothetical protein
MSDTLENVSKAISIVQLAQIVTSLSLTLKNAIERGDAAVTEEDLAASVAANDGALSALDAAIARAKSEGR